MDLLHLPAQPAPVRFSLALPEQGVSFRKGLLSPVT